MNQLLENKVAIVTGAGRGIGRAIAVSLAQAGAMVVLVARSQYEIKDAADEIKRNGGTALAVPTDVSDPSQVDHMLVLTLRAFSGVDILVNNAAVIQPLGKVWETSPTAWAKAIGINTVGPYLCARAVLPYMLEKNGGRIINISSGAADSNLEGASAYNVSKAALERFSGTLAAEVKETGIVVLSFRPGIADTRMQSEMRETSEERFPLVDVWRNWHKDGQLRPPEEVGESVVWLASSFAKNSHGKTLSIDDDGFRQRVAKDLGLEMLPGRKR